MTDTSIEITSGLTTTQVADLCGLPDVTLLMNWKGLKLRPRGGRGGQKEQLRWSPEAVAEAVAYAKKLGYEADK